MKRLFLPALFLLTLLYACNTSTPTSLPTTRPTSSSTRTPFLSSSETGSKASPTPELYLGTPGVDNYLIRAVLSPDGKYAAVATWQGMFLYRADTFTQVWADWRDDLLSSDLVFLADSTRFVTGAMDKAILWNVDDAEPERIFPIPIGGGSMEADVYGVAVTPDGRTLATGAFSGQVYLWDVDSGEPLGSVPTGLGGSGIPMAFSSDGRLLATTGGHSIALWNVDGLTLVGKLPCQTGTQLCGSGAFGFSPDGKYLGTSTGLIDIGARQIVQQWALNIESGLIFSPDGKKIWGGFIKNTTEVHLAAWDLAAGRLDPTFAVIPKLSQFSFSADEKYLLTSSIYGNVILWDVSTKTPLHTLAGTAPELIRPVNSPTPEPDGSPTPQTPQPTPTSLPHETLRFDRGQPRDAVLAPDGRLIVAGTQGMEVYKNQRRTAAWNWPAEMDLTAAPITLSPLGLAAAVSGSEVLLWRIDSAKPFMRWELPADSEFEAAALDFSPDGNTLAAGGWDVTSQNAMAVIWDVQTGSVLLLRRIRMGDPVSALRFSDDGLQLALGVGQKTFLWHPDTDELRELYSGCRGSTHTELAFSSDGQWLIDACNLLEPYAYGFLTLWELADDAIAMFWDEGPFVYSVAFAPDSGTLAVGGEDFIYLKDFARSDELGFVVSSEQSRWLSDLTAPAVRLLFTADSRTLISVLDDGTIDLWDLAVDG